MSKLKDILREFEMIGRVEKECLGYGPRCSFYYDENNDTIGYTFSASKIDIYGNRIRGTEISLLPFKEYRFLNEDEMAEYFVKLKLHIIKLNS